MYHSCQWSQWYICIYFNYRKTFTVFYKNNNHELPYLQINSIWQPIKAFNISQLQWKLVMFEYLRKSKGNVFFSVELVLDIITGRDHCSTKVTVWFSEHLQICFSFWFMCSMNWGLPHQWHHSGEYFSVMNERAETLGLAV